MTELEREKAKAIVEQWLWQPDSWHRKSFVRYYESASMQPDELQLVIAYLKQEETDSIFVLNKMLSLGETWKATDAWFQTSPSDKWAGTDSTKVRIYQAFKPKSDESDGPYTVENGCKYLVTHEFHWNVDDIPTLPASSSGVNYTLQGVARDNDTGLYNCVIERRETVQQDVPSYDTSVTAFERRSEEQHLGVKASAGSVGKSASVRSGTIVKRRVTKNPDCTSDVQNETIVEKPVSGSTVEFRKTLRGSVTIRTDRCQNRPVDGNNMSVGEVRRSEKTEGDLWNNTVQKASGNDVGETSSGSDNTIFEHTDTKVEVVARKPESEAKKAGNGKTFRRSVRKTEDDSFEVEDTVREEKKVVDAVVTRRKTRRGTVVSRIDRNMPSALDGADMQIGEERRSEKTPGDRFNNSTEIVEGTPAGKVSKECSKDAFSERDAVTENVAEPPDDDHVEPAEDGVTHSRTVRVTDENTVDVTDVTVKEIEVVDAEVVYSQTIHGRRVTKRSRSQTSPVDGSGMRAGETRRIELTPGRRYNNEVTTLEPSPGKTMAKSCQRSIFEETDERRTNEESMPGDHAPAAGNGKTYRRVAQLNDDQTVDVTETTTEAIPRSWQTPEVSTNFLYRRQWHFRNFSRSQMKNICLRVTKFFDDKVLNWVNGHRPPSSHDVSPQVQLKDNGRYDGQITVEARWGLTTAGQNGSNECLYYMLKFSYYSFDPWGSRNFSSGTGPVSISSWNGTWHGSLFSSIRAAGRGKSILDSITGEMSIVRAPQISFNPSTEEWELEAITSVKPISKINQWKSTIDTAISRLDRKIAPDGGNAPEPDISDTEYGG